MMFRTATFIHLSVVISLGAHADEATNPHRLEAKGKSEKAWKERSVRTLADLRAMREDTDLDEYGGSKLLRGRATGFFHTEKVKDRWWLVDPAGGLFLSKGVNSVNLGRTKDAKQAMKTTFGDETGWALATTALLCDNGFNCTGAWSDNARLATSQQRIPQTKLWSFMSAYGKKRGGTHMQAGHTGYTNDAIFVFDPGFETFCDEYAKQLIEVKDDPWLIGHFSDNELPLKRSMIDGYLMLPQDEPGYRAAWEWLRKRHGEAATIQSVSDEDRADFLALVAERYFRIVSTAIRKHDPNHLFLGARFHGSVYNFPELFKACGPYVDVVSVNYYSAWTPDPAKLSMWARESGKPVIITEWYAKGADSGMGNTGGAGWLVRTQQDRGTFYQHFTLGLLESRDCVGWHWFRYADNDPNDKSVDPSNRDSNKGIVTAKYVPWQPLLDAMKSLNNRAYGLVNHFDHPTKP